VKVSEEEVTRWFKGENSHGIYAVYQARFKGSIYLGEEFWSLNGNDKWEPVLVQQRKLHRACSHFLR
jgi:hypothetical protein